MPSTLSRPDHATDWLRERRELRALAETASVAAGGGTTLGLDPDVRRPGGWRAEVLADGGRLVSVRLDAVLGTAEVSAVPSLVRAA